MASQTYLNFDGMCWPNPDDPLDRAWNIQHNPTPEGLNYLISVLGAYRQLVYQSQRERNARVASIRKHAKAARDASTEEG